MSEIVPTVKVVSPNSPGGHVVINKADYNEKEHELYKEPKAPAAKASEEDEKPGKSGKQK